jgi:hypothetical protein
VNCAIYHVVMGYLVAPNMEFLFIYSNDAILFTCYGNASIDSVAWFFSWS